ncbi:hypothetical protein [Zhihengliuella salsuginis]|uniref:DUF998 domain-containing protein n=1 Tax=Zhihengliuella salsuginis TaxID=578222 RepID=A0ABQ3GKB5_9MICC|nr:hypothetical protein [Zhihengliuella salsuginis]GHD09204.1 hypothetical protein GCM10008096_21630 [Zhihengliuella salsuginis]
MPIIDPRRSGGTGGEHGRTPAPALVESRALLAGGVAALVALVVGLIGFEGYRPPLAGDRSVAVFAAVTSGTAAGAGFVAGYLQTIRGTHSWLSARPLARQILDGAALVVVHASIAVMSSLVVFRIFQDAFFGLTVDSYAGGVMLAIAAGIAAYAAYDSGSRINASALALLLAVFMASGMLVSMLAAENPLWWHIMFSELGTGTAGLTSFWTFNTTITTSGIILTTLAAFVTRDLTRWAAARDRQDEAAGRARRRFLRPRARVVRWCLIGIGMCMVGIGLVSLHVSEPVHTFFVRLLAAILLVLLLGIPLWAPGYPRAFYVFTYVSTVLLGGAAYLWFPLRYYNLTALELAAAGIVFSWLVVFIRNTTAVTGTAAAPGREDARPVDGSAPPEARP